jgi:hypothetical protein
MREARPAGGMLKKLEYIVHKLPRLYACAWRITNLLDKIAFLRFLLQAILRA